MRIKKILNLLILVVTSVLSSVSFAAGNSDYGDSPLTPNNPSSYSTGIDPNAPAATTTTTTSTKSTSTNSTNSTMDMNAASDGSTVSNTKEINDTGIFTISSGQKCIPSCEGTYLLNGQSYTALLFLKDARNAILLLPYQSKDSLNFKQLMAQKNMLVGTWKPKDDGSIEFKSVAANSTTKTKAKRWSSSNSRSYRDYNDSNSYYDNY